MPFDAVIGLEDPRAAAHGVEDVLRVQHRVRCGAQHARLPGVPRPAGRAAGAQRAAPSIYALRPALALGCTICRRRSSRARTTSTRTCRRATRFRSTTGRWRPTGWSAPERLLGARRRHPDQARAPGRGRREARCTRLSRLGAPELRRSQPRGVPLIEIVTEPDIRSAEDGRRFFSDLRELLVGSASTTGTWRRGACAATPTSRCGRPGRTRSGTKVEIKNLNSFRFVEKALEFEIDRQIDAARRRRPRRPGDAALGRRRAAAPFSMRSKEEAHDYRYFPEPDLPPLASSPRAIEAIRRPCPSCPPRAARGFESAPTRCSMSDVVTLTVSRPRRLLRGDGARRRLAEDREELAARQRSRMDERRARRERRGSRARGCRRTRSRAFCGSSTRAPSAAPSPRTCSTR